MLTVANCVPIVAKTTAANRHDVTELLNPVNDMPIIKGIPVASCYRFDRRHWTIYDWVKIILHIWDVFGGTGASRFVTVGYLSLR